MISKEWWEARWKFALAAVAVLAFLMLAPRPYGAILKEAEFQIERTRTAFESSESFMIPEEALPPGYTQADYEEYERNEFERIQRPDYPVELAGWEVYDVYEAGKYMVLVPLAALLGVALISGEVSRGSIFLLLSKPISRTQIFLTKYAVGAAVLLVTALLSVVVIVLSSYSHGYPAGAISIAEILASAGLFWLGTLSVLGVATLASVLFRDVIRSVIATVAALYALFSLPDLIREMASWWYWSYDRAYFEVLMERQDWYGSFEVFRITRYWSLRAPYPDGPFAGPLPNLQPDPLLSILVCSIAAALPLMIALLLFQKKSY